MLGLRENSANVAEPDFKQIKVFGLCYLCPQVIGPSYAFLQNLYSKVESLQSGEKV